VSYRIEWLDEAKCDVRRLGRATALRLFDVRNRREAYRSKAKQVQEGSRLGERLDPLAIDRESRVREFIRMPERAMNRSRLPN